MNEKITRWRRDHLSFLRLLFFHSFCFSFVFNIQSLRILYVNPEFPFNLHDKAILPILQLNMKLPSVFKI